MEPATYKILAYFYLVDPVKTRTAEIYMDENAILHIVMLEGVVVDVDDAVDNFLVAKHCSADKPVLKLVDARANFEINKPVQLFLDSKEISERTIARAFLMNSALKKVMFNFFVHSKLVPVKFFTDYKKAIVWLRSIQPA